MDWWNEIVIARRSNQTFKSSPRTPQEYCELAKKEMRGKTELVHAIKRCAEKTGTATTLDIILHYNDYCLLAFYHMGPDPGWKHTLAKAFVAFDRAEELYSSAYKPKMDLPPEVWGRLVGQLLDFGECPVRNYQDDSWTQAIPEDFTALLTCIALQAGEMKDELHSTEKD